MRTKIIILIIIFVILNIMAILRFLLSNRTFKGIHPLLFLINSVFLGLLILASIKAI